MTYKKPTNGLLADRLNNTELKTRSTNFTNNRRIETLFIEILLVNSVTWIRANEFPDRHNLNERLKLLHLQDPLYSNIVNVECDKQITREC